MLGTNKNVKTALFTNFSAEPFTGFWNGKPKTIKAGEALYMPDYLAKHFAKHLVNKELLRVQRDSKGNVIREKNEQGMMVPVLVHPGGDTMTSPKFPEQVPMFMELYSRAYHEDTIEDLGDAKDDIDTLIDVANKNRDAELKEAAAKTAGPGEDQVILQPDFDDKDDEDFGPKEEKPKTKKNK